MQEKGYSYQVRQLPSMSALPVLPSLPFADEALLAPLQQFHTLL